MSAHRIHFYRPTRDFPVAVQQISDGVVVRQFDVTRHPRYVTFSERQSGRRLTRSIRVGKWDLSLYRHPKGER